MASTACFGMADKGRMAERLRRRLHHRRPEGQAHHHATTEMATRSGWTPFDGFEAKGWPVATIMRGTRGHARRRDRGRGARARRCGSWRRCRGWAVGVGCNSLAARVGAVPNLSTKWPFGSSGRSFLLRLEILHALCSPGTRHSARSSGGPAIRWRFLAAVFPCPLGFPASGELARQVVVDLGVPIAIPREELLARALAEPNPRICATDGSSVRRFAGRLWRWPS